MAKILKCLRIPREVGQAYVSLAELSSERRRGCRMESLEGFEAVGTRGFYRPSGRVSADLLGDLMTAAIRFARAHDLRDVVVNITSTTGFESPDADYRRRLVKRWAATAARFMRIAVVARRKHIHPTKIGLVVAAEEGLQAHICEDEDEAIAWLDTAAAGDRAAR